MSLKSLGLAVVLVHALAITPAMAVVTFDANVTPDAIFGSGNSNGFFTVDQSNGVELGIRAKIPFSGLITSNGDGSYSYTLAQANPRWNFDWTVNTDYLGASGVKIDDLTYSLQIDFDPSQATDFLEFDPITPSVPVPFFDHSIGDNTTANGAGVEAGDAATYANLIANNNVAQQSWRHAFFPIHPTRVYDPTIDGTYDIALTAFDGTGAVLSSVAIQVIIGAGGVPAISLREVPGASPGDDFNIYVDLLTGTDQVTDLGTILGFDPSIYGIVSVTAGADVDGDLGEPDWSVDFQFVDGGAGVAELHIQDLIGGTVLDCSPAPCSFEVLCITITYVGAPCTDTIELSTDPSAHPLVFPSNHYVHFNPGGGATPVRLDTEISAGAEVEGHAFIRGDVNVSGLATAQDVIDLASHLFGGGIVPDCAAARDTNHDGTTNITDLVTLVQGLFNAPIVLIPDPYPTRGVGPTVLGCNVGLTCP